LLNAVHPRAQLIDALVGLLRCGAGGLRSLIRSLSRLVDLADAGFESVDTLADNRDLLIHIVLSGAAAEGKAANNDETGGRDPRFW